ncbi:MAG: TetR/AcrR family transcriptional regulator [Acidobacteria bacterium]|nr:TetR/AcrR family transcriptional regulator [Acidobacteriota bacterium]
MAREKLETAIRQEQITQAALHLIATQGLKRLSVASVARRIGLVPSAIYRHFENKDQMVDAAIDHIGEMLLTNVRIVCEETPRPLERLHRLLMRHIRLIRENRGIPRVVFSEEVYTGHPERKAKVYAMISKYLDRVAEIVREGQEHNRIRRDVDPKTAALMFLGLIQPAAILWHMSDGKLDVTKHAEKAWKIFSGAIQPR